MNRKQLDIFTICLASNSYFFYIISNVLLMRQTYMIRNNVFKCGFMNHIYGRICVRGKTKCHTIEHIQFLFICEVMWLICWFIRSIRFQKK
jgi:hypothetical protein